MDSVKSLSDHVGFHFLDGSHDTKHSSISELTVYSAFCVLIALDVDTLGNVVGC